MLSVAVTWMRLLSPVRCVPTFTHPDHRALPCRVSLQALARHAADACIHAATGAPAACQITLSAPALACIQLAHPVRHLCGLRAAGLAPERQLPRAPTRSGRRGTSTHPQHPPAHGVMSTGHTLHPVHRAAGQALWEGTHVQLWGTGGAACRFIYSRQPADGEDLQPGDLEAALLAGLGKIKRNQAVRAMIAAGRPCPTGYTVEQVKGRVTVTAAPPEQGGHSWHGREVVALIMAAHGARGLQVRARMPLPAHMHAARWCSAVHGGSRAGVQLVWYTSSRRLPWVPGCWWVRIDRGVHDGCCFCCRGRGGMVRLAWRL